MTLHIEEPSSPTISPGGQVTQQLAVSNPSLAPLKMKLKVSFVSAGTPVSDVGEVGNFPPVLFSLGSYMSEASDSEDEFLSHVKVVSFFWSLSILTYSPQREFN